MTLPRVYPVKRNFMMGAELASAPAKKPVPGTYTVDADGTVHFTVQSKGVAKKEPNYLAWAFGGLAVIGLLAAMSNGKKSRRSYY